MLLLSRLDSMDEDHARAGQECLEGIARSEEHLATLRKQLDEQLNSSDNFREAAERHDRTKSMLEQEEKKHRERIQACRRMADAIFQDYTVQRVISDLSGRFEFFGVPAGRYRVVATEIGGENPRAWALKCPVEGTRPVVLDPRVDSSLTTPYWGVGASAAPEGKDS